VELRVVELPHGSDPAELVQKEGAEAHRDRLAQARGVPDFAARRALAQADLSTPLGRDRALDEVMPFIHSLEANPATRDELVSFVADRLDVPPSFLMTRPAASAAPAPAAASEAPPARRHQSIDAALRTERAVLSLAVGDRDERG
jgi:DNA primase